LKYVIKVLTKSVITLIRILNRMNSSFIIFLERSVACKGYESYMQGLRAEGEFVYIVCNF